MKKTYRNTLKTKKAIKEAFVQLVDEKKDIYRISVTELIKKADIAKSTFYLHYEDIFSVAEEFENEILNALCEIINNTSSTKESFENSLELSFNYLKEKEHIYSQILTSSTPSYFIEKLKKRLSEQVFNKIDIPFLSTNPHIRSAQISFFANGTVDLVVDYFKGKSKISLDEIKKVILLLINQVSK